MSYLKDREIWLSSVPTGNPPAGYVWVFIQNGVFVVRDSSGVDKIMATTTGTVTNATSASYVEYSNVANKPALISGSSQVSYTGLSDIPSGIVSSSVQIGEYGIFATTGSNQFDGSQAITGSLTVTGEVVAQTLNVQQVTSSIVYSSGSNVFGNDLGNTQQFTGSVSVTGSLAVNGTSAVTGTGTTNYLPKFTGTSTIGNSQIFDDGTNVGIGTNASTTKFRSNGTVQITAAGSPTNGAGLEMGYGNFTAGRTTITSYNRDGAAFLGADYNALNYIWYTSSSQKMTLDSSGNLGIGTSAYSVSAGYTGLGINNATNGGLLDLLLNDVKKGELYITSTSFNMYGFAGVGLNLTVDNNASKGLFIATTGAATFSSSVTALSLGLGNNTTGFGDVLLISNTNANVYPRVNRSSTSYEAGWKLSTGNSDTWYTGLRSADNTGSYHFYSYTTNSSVAQITENGKLLVGTTSDLGNYRLQVASSTSSAAVLSIQNTSASGYSGAHLQSSGGSLMGHFGYANASTGAALQDVVYFGSIASKAVVFTTADTERMLITSAGRLLVNTTSESDAIFQVHNNSSNYAMYIFANTIYSGSYRIMRIFANGNNIMDIGSSNGTDISFSNNQNGFITLGTNGSERIRITSGGNVLIGTTTDGGYRLDAAGQIRSYSATPLVVSMSSNSDNNAIIAARWQGGVGMEMIYHPNTAVGFIQNTYQATSGQVFGDIHFRQNVGGTMASRVVLKATSGNVEHQMANKALTFVQLTSVATKTFSTTGEATGTFSVTDFSGIPSNAKAVQVYGWYHITGYSVGSGQGDHAVSWFGIYNDGSPYSFSGPGAPWPGMNSSFVAASYGSFLMEHDGDTSVGSSDINYYGSWHQGIIHVNSAGNIVYRLAAGLSGGTHYNALYATGYWI